MSRAAHQAITFPPTPQGKAGAVVVFFRARLPVFGRQFSGVSSFASGGRGGAGQLCLGGQLCHGQRAALPGGLRVPESTAIERSPCGFDSQNALPPGFEPGSPDSKSGVLTTTLRELEIQGRKPRALEEKVQGVP